MLIWFYNKIAKHIFDISVKNNFLMSIRKNGIRTKKFSSDIFKLFRGHVFQNFDTINLDNLDFL